MTALEHEAADDSSGDHPLAPGALPAVIRKHLLPEDRGRFDEALRAVANADEDAQWHCLERWRGIAMIQSDRESFTHLARHLAERKSGRPSPADEPLEVTRTKAGL